MAEAADHQAPQLLDCGRISLEIARPCSFSSAVLSSSSAINGPIACCTPLRKARLWGSARENSPDSGIDRVMAFSGKRDNFFLVLENSSEPTPVVLNPEGDAPSAPPVDSASEPRAAEPVSLALSSSAGGQDSSSSQAVAPKAPPTESSTATSVSDAAAPTSVSDAAAPTSGVMTTAEAIAAELAAADAARPEVSLITFAPENLLPGQGLSQRRRRPGASIKTFSSMAAELFKG